MFQSKPSDGKPEGTPLHLLFTPRVWSWWTKGGYLSGHLPSSLQIISSNHSSKFFINTHPVSFILSIIISRKPPTKQNISLLCVAVKHHMHIEFGVNVKRPKVQCRGVVWHPRILPKPLHRRW